MDNVYNIEDYQLAVADYVRNQIFCINGLQQGDQINERLIARKLNISRAPVREALKKLEEQGIVTSVRYKGWFVTDFDKKDLYEISKIRTQLELNIFEAIVEENQLSDEDLKYLESLNSQMRELTRQNKNWQRNCQFADLDMAFHMGLLRNSKMKWTKRLLTNLFYQIRLCLVNNLFEEDHIYRCVERHEKMIACFRNRDLACLRDVLALRFLINYEKDDIHEEVAEK